VQCRLYEMPKTFAAAKSMFNSTDELRYGKAKALSGMVGGQEREQTVLTPDWLLDAIREVAPIGLDPCTTPENPVGARFFCSVEGAAGTSQPSDVALGFTGSDGLAIPWGWPLQRAPLAACAYVNPPYSDLKDWLQKCSAEAGCGVQVYLLCPVRPQRRWFNEYTKGHTVVSLAPFPFKGHKSAFPAPLCLVCYNLPVPNLGKYETGRWVQL